MIMKNFKKLIAGSITFMTMLTMTPTIVAHAEWKQNNTGWWYDISSNYKYNYFIGWHEIGGLTYFFDEDGYMKTGWVKDKGNWYYLNPNGSMAHDCYIGNYYLDSNGIWINTVNTPQLYFTPPSTWAKTIIDGTDVYFLDNKGTSVILLTNSLQGYSLEANAGVYASNVKKFYSINSVDVKKRVFNNNNVIVLNYTCKYNGKNEERYEVLYSDDNKYYKFTLSQSGKVSDENLLSFATMLATVQIN